MTDPGSALLGIQIFNPAIDSARNLSVIGIRKKAKLRTALLKYQVERSYNLSIVSTMNNKGTSERFMWELVCTLQTDALTEIQEVLTSPRSFIELLGLVNNEKRVQRLTRSSSHELRSLLVRITALKAVAIAEIQSQEKSSVRWNTRARNLDELLKVISADEDADGNKSFK